MNGFKTNLLRVLFIILSVVFLAVGFHNEEFIPVLQKAVTVCLECIGIG